MGASLLLTLDTHAPQITWGTAQGRGGEQLVVSYSLDEPGILDALIELPDGRMLALTDTGTALEVMLPLDTPTGTATIHAHLRDDVWNEAQVSATAQLVAAVTGQIAPESIVRLGAFRGGALPA